MRIISPEERKEIMLELSEASFYARLNQDFSLIAEEAREKGVSGTLYLQVLDANIAKHLADRNEAKERIEKFYENAIGIVIDD
jgi:hypothetical protein